MHVRDLIKTQLLRNILQLSNDVNYNSEDRDRRQQSVRPRFKLSQIASFGER